MTFPAFQHLQPRAPDGIPSPALLVSLENVNANLDHMVRLVDDVKRLRPHVKTHKMPEMMRLQKERGITKFKCATIAEAEMCAQSGAAEVLLAYPPIGPNGERLLQLIRTYRETTFATCLDDPAVARHFSELAGSQKVTVPVMVDVDCGMSRTGVSGGTAALDLYRLLDSLPGLQAIGIHAYDGHVTDADPERRRKAWAGAFAPIEQLAQDIRSLNLPEPLIVAGGTPTFPFHAQAGDRECSPGTTVFWDAGYGQRYVDLPFRPAAAVFTRIISRPGSNRICLDLGHKSIASENPHPRVVFPDLPEARALVHSEEHLVLEVPKAERYPVGAALVGIPWHICPTVALYHEAVVLSAGAVTAHWEVTARKRRITI